MRRIKKMKSAVKTAMCFHLTTALFIHGTSTQMAVNGMSERDGKWRGYAIYRHFFFSIFAIFSTAFEMEQGNKSRPSNLELWANTNYSIKAKKQMAKRKREKDTNDFVTDEFLCKIIKFEVSLFFTFHSIQCRVFFFSFVRLFLLFGHRRLFGNKKKKKEKNIYKKKIIIFFSFVCVCAENELQPMVYLFIVRQYRIIISCYCTLLSSIWWFGIVVSLVSSIYDHNIWFFCQRFIAARKQNQKNNEFHHIKWIIIKMYTKKKKIEHNDEENVLDLSSVTISEWKTERKLNR